MIFSSGLGLGSRDLFLDFLFPLCTGGRILWHASYLFNVIYRVMLGLDFFRQGVLGINLYAHDPSHHVINSNFNNKVLFYFHCHISLFD